MSLIHFLTTHTHDPRQPAILSDYLRTIRQSFRTNSDEIKRYGDDEEFWIAFERVWRVLAGKLAEGDESVLGSVEALSLVSMSLSGAEPDYQVRMLKYIEPTLVKILLIASSLSNLEDPLWTDTTKSSVRAFANMITGNDDVAAAYLPIRLAAEEQDNLFTRLLASKDQQILQPVLIMVLFLILDSPDRTLLFVESRAGVRLLDRACTLVRDALDQSVSVDTSPERKADPLLEMTFAIVRNIIKMDDCFRIAFHGQATVEEGFLISESQITFLKFLDGYLGASTASASPVSSTWITPFFLDLFTTYDEGLNEDRPKESRDAITFTGMILVLEGLIVLGLGSKQGREGIVEVLERVVVLLARTRDLTAPPSKMTPIEEESATIIEPLAIGHLKRNCVRILGILSFDSKEAQDRIREAGGLGLLLGMCQISDVNPTLREHALFAIRNILHRNQANQDLVAGMTPEYLVGADGALRDLPPALR